MKRYVSRFLKQVPAIGVIMCLCNPGTYAAFLDTGLGARPTGMGGAFSAVADDANAVFYNPAGLAQLTQAEAHFTYTDRFSGLEDVSMGSHHVAYAHPFATGGTLAVTWLGFNARSLYREDTVSCSYARMLEPFKEETGLVLLAGGSVNLLRTAFTLDDTLQGDPVFADGKQSQAVGVDIGLLLVGGRTRGAFSAKHLNRPDIGFNQQERLDTEYRFGVDHNFGHIVLADSMHTSLDVVSIGGDIALHAGLESSFLDDTMMLRCGASRYEMAFGLGGLFMPGQRVGVQLDYAFIWPFEIQHTNGSHRVSMILRY